MSPGAGTAIGLTALDWSIVAGYLVLALGLGLWMSRRQRGPDSFFLAGRRIPVWAAALSVLATSLSAVTFIGAPADAYQGNLTYLSLNIGALLAAVIVAVLFIPAYYKAGVTTVYGLLEQRFGEGARSAASAMFMAGRLLASGARLFVAAIPVSMIVYGDLASHHLIGAIVITATVAAVYTSIGGIGAVIWTDAAQVLVLLGAALAAAWLLIDLIPLSIKEMVETLNTARDATGAAKLAIVDTRFDLSLPYTLWSAIIGFTLFNMAAYGTDQDLAQRMLTCRTATRGAWSLIAANLLGLCLVALFLSLGLLLFLHYGEGGEGGPVDDPRRVFLTFILSEIPTGLRGLMIAGLAAAAMSSLDSALNALASTTVCDFYKPRRPGRAESHYMRASRAAVVVWATLLAGFASVCVFWQQRSDETLLQFALGVMIYAYAGLLGVFLSAILTRRGSTRSVWAALAGGFLTVLALQFGPPLLGSLGAAEDVLRISLGWRMAAGTLVSLLICISARGDGRGIADA